MLFRSEIAIWAAVGGRGSLFGPILGAFVVNGAKSWFTVAFPQFWLYFLGLLFVLVTLFMPKGIVGLAMSLGERWRARRGASVPTVAATDETQAAKEAA